MIDVGLGCAYLDSHLHWYVFFLFITFCPTFDTEVFIGQVALKFLDTIVAPQFASIRRSMLPPFHYQE